MVGIRVVSLLTYWEDTRRKRCQTSTFVSPIRVKFHRVVTGSILGKVW